MPKKRPPTSQELNAAARQRVNGRQPRTTTSATAYFTAHGTRSTERNDCLLPTTRIPESLAEAIAEYGNTHGLTPSETVRRLLRGGLLFSKGHNL